jgi:hypothetical protein
MNVNNVSLIVSVVVGCVGIYLAVQSWRRDADQPISRVKELELIRRTLQREIGEMQERIEALEAAQAERDELIREQAERIADLEAELELYRTQWAKKHAATATPKPARTLRDNRATTPQLRALRDVLVLAYGDQARAREVAERAGIKPDTLPIDKPDMATWWDAVLYGANNQDRVVQLVETALNDQTVYALHGDFVAWLEARA